MTISASIPIMVDTAPTKKKSMISVGSGVSIKVFPPPECIVEHYDEGEKGENKINDSKPTKKMDGVLKMFIKKSYKNYVK